jgi:uncharacterized protein (DUF779 family)
MFLHEVKVTPRQASSSLARQSTQEPGASTVIFHQSGKCCAQTSEGACFVKYTESRQS